MEQAPTAPYAAEHSDPARAHPAWRGGRRPRVLADAERSRRLAELPARCRMLAAGVDNSENDAELVFAGLPFADVMRAVERDLDVFLALRQLSPDQIKRLARNAA